MRYSHQDCAHCKHTESQTLAGDLALVASFAIVFFTGAAALGAALVGLGAALGLAACAYPYHG